LLLKKFIKKIFF